MANLITWFDTNLPTEMADNALRELLPTETGLALGTVGSGSVNKAIRDSSVHFFGSSNWVAGLIWYYLQKTNKNNFGYDITDFDNGRLQYTVYGSDQHYEWHKDQDLESFYQPKLVDSSSLRNTDKVELDSENVRKLSFSLLISDPSEFEGGELQFKDNSGKTHIMTREKGKLVIFDSRTLHRVSPVEKGVRRSIVGWAVGPRWK